MALGRRLLGLLTLVVCQVPERKSLTWAGLQAKGRATKLLWWPFEASASYFRVRGGPEGADARSPGPNGAADEPSNESEVARVDGRRWW